MKEITAPYPRRRIAPRSDGYSTQRAVLEAAGHVFAERGYSKATSREICEKAGVNTASINYYFGGKEALYEEVLIEAHRQLVSFEELNAVVSSSMPPEDKLRSFLTLAVQTALKSPELWGLPVLLREVASPSSHLPDSLIKSILPKLNVVRNLVCEITGFALHSEKAIHASAMVILPCIFLVLFPEKTQSVLLPNFTNTPEAMVESMVCYTLGGLQAMKDANVKT